jgi:arylsulfatase A-like enzyme/tetratricopeptide (TPR) repeat protein
MKRITKFYTLILVLFVVVVTVGLWYLHYSGFLVPKISQIILISIDTCRADYLSCYGYPRQTTPNIDTFAQQAVRFEKAITQIPTTLSAHASMLTGTIPPYHGVRNNFNFKLHDRNTSIAEILRERGYRTGAIVSAFVLDKQFGLNQGFETYHDDFIEAKRHGGYFERKGNEASDIACRWLQEHRDDKFFLFLHYFDPHNDYEPPEPFASNFADNLYAGEIAYTDYCIGRVIEKLKALRLYDSALIIIVGDHGESLGEHGEETHGYFMYQSTVWVPLIIKPPGGSKPTTVSEPVAVTDIVPTILSMLRIPVPAEVQGRDLSSLFAKKQESKKQNAIYCEAVDATRYGCNPLFGVVQGQWKYIETNRPELYDLSRDPDETKNLAEDEKERAQVLRGQLKRIMSEQSYQGETDGEIALDPASIQRLASLGYIGAGSVSDEFEFDTSKDDPKDLIEFYKLHMKLHRLFLKERNYDEAEKLCRELIRQRPNYSDPYSYLGKIAVARGKPAESIAYFKESLRLNNEVCEVHEDLAGALETLGNLDEAAKHYQEALRIMPEWYRYYISLGAVRARQGHLEQATSLFKKALEIHPDCAEAYYNLGNISILQGRMDEATEHWIESLRIKPDQADVLKNLGKVSFQKGKVEDAIGYWKRSIHVNPEQPDVYSNLGFALSKKGDINQAIEYYLIAVKLDPGYYQAHTNLAMLLAEKGKITEALQHWTQSLEIEPKQAAAHRELGMVLARQNKVAEAVLHLREAVHLNPNQPGVLNYLAWILATYQDKTVHNPKEAVRFAQKACQLTDYKYAELLDTLAVAYAAAGQFDKAITTAQKAVDLAIASGRAEQAQVIRDRLKLYRNSEPYQEYLPSERPSN